MVKEALKNNQHVLCVKPLVLKYECASEIEKEAYEKAVHEARKSGLTNLDIDI